MHPDKNRADPMANEKFSELGNGAQRTATLALSVCHSG